MPFIPLTQKISWRNPPTITIALITINIFVFFVFQGQDSANETETQAFYFDSGLDQIEMPLYADATSYSLRAKCY